MKAKKILFRVIPVVLIAAVVLAVTTKKPAEELPAETVPTPVPLETIDPELDVLSAQEREQYEQLQKRIDEGDSIGFANLLLEGSVSENLYEYLIREDGALAERIVLDAMVQFAQTGDLESLVRLRQMGYVSDPCFENYWEVMGSALPEETASEVDAWLVHELHMAYLRDSYAVRSFREMRESGLIPEDLHSALVQALGFDYMNDETLNQEQKAPQYTLTQEEKAAYEAVLEYIDRGDCAGVINGMLTGEVTQAVYAELMKADAEVLDYVIAEAMTELAQAGNYQQLLQLCAEGYVSESCYECYWEMEGFELPEALDDGEHLLYELEQIYRHNENGLELLRQIWKSGLLADEIHRQMISRLGVDYTQGA